jgi:hypothetical protein
MSPAEMRPVELRPGEIRPAEIRIKSSALTFNKGIPFAYIRLQDF